MTRSVKFQHAWAVLTAALFALTLTACGDGSNNGSSGYGNGDSTTSAAESPSETASAGGAASVATTTDDTLGEFLVDGDGKTLYLYTPDTSSTSTCYDTCATQWPPLLTDSADVAASGSADASMLGTTERKEGTMQVTYNDHPLYHYYLDKAAGDIEGQGVGGIWYVVTPDGSATKTSK